MFGIEWEITYTIRTVAIPTPSSEVDITFGYSRKTSDGDYREWVIQGSSTFAHSPHILHVFHET
jgi:hypothetical protein